MIGTITSALSSLKAAVDLGKLALENRDDAKMKEARAAMLERVIDVQDACMRLQETNNALLQEKHTLAQEKRQLEERIAEVEQRAARLTGYELTHTPAGSTVYMEKGAAPGSRMAKYICATCAERGDITYLQPDPGWYFLTCPTHGNLHFQRPDGETMVMSTGPRDYNPYDGF
ncbi:MAG: hypothetical protein WBF84_06755 [Castellaniella sp.]|uniref:hypothetical protein n=1 Tax=Castellaniella sp. TaxID=1955812 RepID=UPI003C75277D